MGNGGKGDIFQSKSELATSLIHALRTLERGGLYLSLNLQMDDLFSSCWQTLEEKLCSDEYALNDFGLIM